MTSVYLCLDPEQLLTHLHPDADNLTLYVAGGSFGMVPAQILYGLPYDIFPLGRHIAGLLILVPFSSRRCHRDHTKALTWANYIAMGPPSRIVPFRLIPRLIIFAIRRRLRTTEDAVKFVDDQLFSKMNDAERAAFKAWSTQRGMAKGQLQREMAENYMRSVAHSWAGFLDVVDIMHSDWGVCPGKLDEEHAGKPVHVVTSDADERAGSLMAQWLAKEYG